MKKVIKGIILALLVLSLTATAVYGAFTATLSIIESSGNSYDMIASNVTTNIDYMADSGYFDTATGLDTRVLYGTSEQPHMLVTDRITFAGSLSAYQSKNYQFTTGNTPLTAFDIITGYGGTINVTDSANLEHGANFTDTFNGWIDTDAGSAKYILRKQQAYEVFVNPSTSGTINATILDTSTTTETKRPTANGHLIELTPQAGTNWGSVSDSNDATYVYSTSTHPTYKTDFYTCANMTAIGGGITQVQSTIRIRSFNAGVTAYGKFAMYIDGTAYYGSEHTQGNSWANYTDTFTTNPDTGLAWTIDDINDMEIGVQLASDDPGTSPGYCAEVWIVVTFYPIDIEVSTTGVASGEHELILSINATHFYMELDSVVVDSVAIGGSSVRNSAYNYELFLNDVMPYADNMTIDIGGTEQLWFEPNDIIELSGTDGVLPDRQGGDNDGAIYFGSNPAGVAPTIAELISDYSPTATDPAETPDFIPESNIVPPTDRATKETALASHPLYSWFESWNTATSVSILTQFQWAYLALAIFVFAGTFTWLRNMMLSGGLFVAVIGLGVTQSVYDWWLLLIVIPFWIGLTLMENRQTI